MNFFGHAVVASWASDDPALAFGAMLPDFGHMLGLTRIDSSHPTIRAGIALHHASDDVFHNGLTFVRLQNQGRAALMIAGLPRGATLALSHVGVELMLDRELSHQPDHLKHYLLSIEQGLRHCSSLSWSLPTVTAGALAGQKADDGHPFERLLTLLGERADKLAPRNGDELAERLFRILSPRPRLTFPRAALPQVASWADALWPELRMAVPTWLNEISAGLSLRVPEAAYSAKCAP
ncbi:MAG: hypothetical protein RJA70_839 [Pseudomonadota bacterium]|jgi:hypothetical protein